MNSQQIAEIIALYDKHIDRTRENFVGLNDKRVLVACSGGCDSVALAFFCKAYELEFGLAYIEHGINPSTIQCETVVKELAELLEVPSYSTHLNLKSDGKATSNIEATARDERYRALEMLRSTHGYDLIATAHQLDDTVETFLINLMRGSGSGISSLEKARQNIVRPMLNWRKKDLKDIVEKIGFETFEDQMNHDPRFVRNLVRHELIPLMEDISNRDVSKLIANTYSAIGDDNKFLDSLACSLWPKDNPSTKTLVDLDPVLQVHAIRSWIQGLPPSSEELDRIMQVVKHEIKSTQISGDRTIWRSGAVLYQDVTSQIKN